MADAADKPIVVVRPPLRVLVDPHMRQAMDDLVAELIAEGQDARLQLPDPGQFSIQNSLDTVNVVITTGASTLVALVVTDLYKATKRWMGKRMAEDKAAGPMYITLRGPDGKPLKNLLGRSGEIKDMNPDRDRD